MIRVSEEAKRLLGSLSTSDGEVLRLIPRSPEADGLGGLVGGLAFRHGRGEGADQIVQHDGRQVLRIERSVRRSFDAAGTFQDTRRRLYGRTLGVAGLHGGYR